MEQLYKKYNVINDIQHIINLKVHQSYQKDINFVIDNIIGFNKEFINKWINTNELYLILNKYFVFRKKINIYRNITDYDKKINIYSATYNKGLYLLFKTDWRNMPVYRRMNDMSLYSYNLRILEKYFIKNIFYSDLIFHYFINIDKDDTTQQIIKYNNERINIKDYTINDLIDDLTDTNKLNKYKELLLEKNIYNDDFILYCLNDGRTQYINWYSDPSAIINSYNKKILEFKLKYVDFNALLKYDFNKNKNFSVDLKYLYKIDLQNLMVDNNLTKFKRLTKKQLIKRLLEI